MKSLARALLFLVLLVPTLALVHTVMLRGHHYLRTKHDARAVYLLGDSRSVDDIDLDRMRERLGRPVYRLAFSGASPYSIRASSELIPPGATVLIAPSHGMFARPRDKVSYRSAISPSTMRWMMDQGYDAWFYRQILLDNRNPLQAPFSNFNIETLPARDRPDTLRERFDEVYLVKEAPWFYRPNQRLFLSAIDLLQKKGCAVSLIELPVTSTLSAVIQSSIYRGLLEDMPELEHMPGLTIYRGVKLDESGPNIWYDLDHLNARGQVLMTDWILEHVFGAPAPGAASPASTPVAAAGHGSAAATATVAAPATATATATAAPP